MTQAVRVAAAASGERRFVTVDEMFFGDFGGSGVTLWKAMSSRLTVPMALTSLILGFSQQHQTWRVHNKTWTQIAAEHTAVW
jgi:hypothetical protein